MNSIFMNSKNSKTSDCHRLLLNLTDRINLKWSDEHVALSKSYRNNKSKTPVPTWFEEFELPDGSYSISDIQDCFEHIYLKKHGENTINPSIRIYVSKIENSKYYGQFSNYMWWNYRKKNKKYFSKL